MKQRLYIVAFCMIGLLVVAAGLSIFDFGDEAKFGLDSLTALSVVIAVVFAMYGDALRQEIDPIRLSLELPRNANNYCDQPEINGKTVDRYCHHLSVKNQSSDAVKSCMPTSQT